MDKKKTKKKSVKERHFEKLYERAKSPSDLPWHREKLPPLPLRMLESRSMAGTALDVGCGTGVYAVHLAKLGYQVTAIDYIEGALRMTEELAGQENVKLDLHLVDALSWSPTGRFDVILDSGCLHSLSGKDREVYRDRLVEWLAPGGDLWLAHFAPLHFLNWRPMGPRRYSREKILELFRPRLSEIAHEIRVEREAFPIGPRVKIIDYWLRHSAKEDRGA